MSKYASKLKLAAQWFHKQWLLIKVWVVVFWVVLNILTHSYFLHITYFLNKQSGIVCEKLSKDKNDVRCIIIWYSNIWCNHNYGESKYKLFQQWNLFLIRNEGKHILKCSSRIMCVSCRVYQLNVCSRVINFKSYYYYNYMSINTVIW